MKIKPHVIPNSPLNPFANLIPPQGNNLVKPLLDSFAILNEPRNIQYINKKKTIELREFSKLM